MHGILLAGAPSCNLELLDSLQNRYVGLLLVLHFTASLEPLAHWWNASSLSLFSRYYFRRYSFKLAQLISLCYSWWRSTRYCDRLHDFFWPPRLNGWVFDYRLKVCWFKSCCSHLVFWYCACFKQGVPWHSGNYTVWIHYEMHTWHKNIQLKKQAFDKLRFIMTFLTISRVTEILSASD